jgi:uncharacterized protein
MAAPRQPPKPRPSDLSSAAQNVAETFRQSLRNLPRLFGRGLIKAYRYTLSPLIGYECRHLPTCSHYAEEAIDRYGLWAGGWMTLARLVRCQPFGTSGLDFVPDTAPASARWYLPWRYARWRGTNDGAGRPDVHAHVGQ